MARPRVANVSDARALRMCELALEHLGRDPAAVRTLAFENVAVWERVQSCDPLYVHRWRDLLPLPAEALARTLLAETDEAQALRANNPFAGLFSWEERNLINTARPE